jgi:HK97 gp10 family phage protein
MKFNYSITGAAELEKLLKLLPGKIATKIGQDAVRAGGNLLKKAVQADAPEHLKETIVVRKKKLRSRKAASAVEYVLGSTSPKAHLFEFGVAPHKIIAGERGHRSKKTGEKQQTGKQVLANTAEGIVFGTEVNHPGFAAKPFFRPAIDANFEAYLQKVAEVLARGLAREGAKFATFGGGKVTRKR